MAKKYLSLRKGNFIIKCEFDLSLIIVLLFPLKWITPKIYRIHQLAIHQKKKWKILGAQDTEKTQELVKFLVRLGNNKFKLFESAENQSFNEQLMFIR